MRALRMACLALISIIATYVSGSSDYPFICLGVAGFFGLLAYGMLLEDIR